MIRWLGPSSGEKIHIGDIPLRQLFDHDDGGFQSKLLACDLKVDHAADLGQVAVDGDLCVADAQRAEEVIGIVAAVEDVADQAVQDAVGDILIVLAGGSAVQRQDQPDGVGGVGGDAVEQGIHIQASAGNGPSSSPTAPRRSCGSAPRQR